MWWLEGGSVKGISREVKVGFARSELTKNRQE